VLAVSVIAVAVPSAPAVGIAKVRRPGRAGVGRQRDVNDVNAAWRQVSLGHHPPEQPPQLVRHQPLSKTRHAQHNEQPERFGGSGDVS
jgi:hypothetical protein